jgi:hypothetical protein
MVGEVLGRIIAAAVLGMCSAGVITGCLTLKLNPDLHSRAFDALTLMATFVAGSAVVGLVLGLAAGGTLWLIGKANGHGGVRFSAEGLESTALGVIGLSPVLYALALPDLGLAGSFLTRLLFSPRAIGTSVVVLTVCFILGAAGLFLGSAFGALRRRAGVSIPVVTSIGLIILLFFGSGFALLGPPSPREIDEVAADVLDLPERLLIDNAPPLILLCVDGADLDDVIMPMVETGDLPVMRQMMDEGTWGELETFAPTLSPAVWTTLATGTPKTRHGIHGFTVFHLPGLDASIHEFPLHSGLNFRLIPLLERIPGMPLIRVPYTSDMRRVPAVWDVVGRFSSVGIFSWRTTWPVEPVNGFAVASAVTLGETSLRATGGPNPERSLHPTGLFSDMEDAPKLPGIDAVRPYLEPGTPLNPRDRKQRFIRSSLSRRPIHALKHLMTRFEPSFTAAAFYSVDAFNHYFGEDHVLGGEFAPALEERYRFMDERLGELLEALDPETHVIVVSDHGFDFENQNHVHAPAGVFIARGPGFTRGRRVRGLTVFDVAPLVLHLVGLPPGRDMPSAASGSYLTALDPIFARGNPVGTIPSWGTRAAFSLRPQIGGGERDILDELRSLGYIE